jgi:hypothetical protein
MLRTPLLILAIAVLTAPVFAEPTEPVSELYPLAVGSVWMYSDNEGPASIEFVAEAREHEGVTWYRLQGEPMGPSESEIFEPYDLWVTNRPDGQGDATAMDIPADWEDVRDREIDTETVKEPRPFELTGIQTYLRYPVEKGETYRVNDGEQLMIVLATDESVTVPAGTFECIVYKQIDPQELNYTYTCYVAVGVGIVKAETWQDGRKTTESLSFYRLAGQD